MSIRPLNIRYLGTQATAECYKQWKIRADATMITSDNPSAGPTSSNDSSYFLTLNPIDR